MLDLDSLIDKSHKTISKINTSIEIDQSGKSTIHHKQNSSSFGEATPLTEKELEEAILNNVEGGTENWETASTASLQMESKKETF